MQGIPAKDIPELIIMDTRKRRLWTYYRKIRELTVA